MAEALVQAAKRTDSLVEAVEGFLRAPTWEASRAIVYVEPRLLSPETQELLSTFAIRAREQNDEQSASLLEVHRQLLERCGSEGVESAFRGLIVEDAGSLELDEIVAQLANAPIGPADLPRRIELTEHALSQVSKEKDPELWALLQSSLGTSLLVSPIGDRAANLERSIAALQAAAVELRRLDRHDDVGRTLNNLGLALESRWVGVPDENLEHAMAAYSEALEYFTSAQMAYDRAQALNNLANAYNRRALGGRDENRERAIELYEEALVVLSQDSKPQPAWDEDTTLPSVRTRLNLGVALMERFRGDRVENLKRAIAHFTAGLQLTDPTIDPTGWADLQVNLGNALSRQTQATGDDDCFHRAVIAYESALQVYGDTNASSNRALALSNLANILRARPGGSSARDIERAIGTYEEAIELLDRERETRDWALAWNNLGEAYAEQPDVAPAERAERAIAAFGQAADALDRLGAPVEYAQVMKNLGTAYRKRLTGDRKENLETALRYYDEALRIRSEVYGPDHPRTASVLYSIAKAQVAAGDDEAARRSLERAVQIDEASGEPRRRLPRRYRLLAETATRLDDREAAERAIERALALDEELYGRDHPDVFTDLRILAEIREADGRLAEAMGALESAVTLEELGHGEVSGGVRSALTRLADMLRAAGDLAGAERTMERAVRLDETLFGSDHPRVAESLLKLAQVLNDAHEKTRARETLERAKRIEEKTGGRLPPSLTGAIATMSQLIKEPITERYQLELMQAPAWSTTPARVQFSETLRGQISFDLNDPPEGPRTGLEAGGAIELRLDVFVHDLDLLLNEGEHAATVTGHAECALLGGHLTIRDGTYSVRQLGQDREEHVIDYQLELLDQGGEAHALHGRRTINAHGSDLFERATSVVLWVQTADGRTAAGAASVRHLDFLDQLQSIRVDAGTTEAGITALERFGRASFGPLWEFYEFQRLQLGPGSQDQA